MPEISVVAVIQSAVLGADLVIEDITDPTVPYSLVRNGVGPGSSSARKVTVESPFVAGRHVVHNVMGMGSVTLQVRVRGSSFDWLDAYTGNLLNFVQDTFHLLIRIDSVEHTWPYEGVDNWVVGDPSSANLGNWEDVSLRSYTQTVTMQTMRHPISDTGRF